MDRQTLKERLSDPRPLDEESFRDFITQLNKQNEEIHDRYGAGNMLVLVEECSELATELIRDMRGEPNSLGILEEWCDVRICIQALYDALAIPELTMQNLLASELGVDGRGLVDTTILEVISVQGMPSRTDDTLFNAVIHLIGLQQAVSKVMRSDKTRTDRIDQAAEKLAKVIISMYQLKALFQLTDEDIETVLNIKMERYQENNKKKEKNK